MKPESDDCRYGRHDQCAKCSCDCHPKRGWRRDDEELPRISSGLSAAIWRAEQ